MAGKTYIGVEHEVYDYDTNVNISPENITTYFTEEVNTYSTYYEDLPTGEFDEYGEEIYEYMFSSYCHPEDGGSCEMTLVAKHDATLTIVMTGGSETYATLTYQLPSGSYNVEELDPDALSGYDEETDDYTGNYQCTIKLKTGQQLCIESDGDMMESYLTINIIIDSCTTGTRLVSTAESVRKAYMGIDNIARPILRAYIGDASGKARPVFSLDGEPMIYATSFLDVGERSLRYPAAFNFNNHAIFAGGYKDGLVYHGTLIRTFDKYLTRYNTNMSAARHYCVGTALDSCAIVAGGQVITNGGDINGTYSTVVDAIDTSFTVYATSTLDDIGNIIYATDSATAIGDYMVVALGCGKANIFDSSLTKMSINFYGDVSARSPQVVANDNYAMFAGGIRMFDDTYVLDSSLTVTNGPTLSSYRVNHCGIRFGDMLMFGGGSVSGTYVSSSDAVSDTFDVFDNNLTRTTGFFNTARTNVGASTLTNLYALFAGGCSNAAVSDSMLQSVEVIDHSLTTHDLLTLANKDRDICGTYVGNYTLFAGGLNTGRGIVFTY